MLNGKGYAEAIPPWKIGSTHVSTGEGIPLPEENERVLSWLRKVKSEVKIISPAYRGSAVVTAAMRLDWVGGLFLGTMIFMGGMGLVLTCDMAV